MLWHSITQAELAGKYVCALAIFLTLQMLQLLCDIHQRGYGQRLIKVFYRFEQLMGHHSFQ